MPARPDSVKLVRLPPIVRLVLVRVIVMTLILRLIRPKHFPPPVMQMLTRPALGVYDSTNAIPPRLPFDLLVPPSRLYVVMLVSTATVLRSVTVPRRIAPPTFRDPFRTSPSHCPSGTDVVDGAWIENDMKGLVFACLTFLMPSAALHCLHDPLHDVEMRNTVGPLYTGPIVYSTTWASSMRGLRPLKTARMTAPWTPVGWRR